MRDFCNFTITNITKPHSRDTKLMNKLSSQLVFCLSHMSASACFSLPALPCMHFYSYVCFFNCVYCWLFLLFQPNLCFLLA